MENSKKYKLLLGLGAITCSSVVSMSVVSCTSDKNVIEQFGNALPTFQFQLNEKAKELTVTQFISQINSLGMQSALTTYTSNINDLLNTNSEEGIKVEVTNYWKVTSSNSITVRINFAKGNDVSSLDFALIGFKLESEFLNDIKNRFLEDCKKVIANNVGTNTAQDVWDKWYDSTISSSANSLNILNNYISNLPIDQQIWITEGKWVYKFDDHTLANLYIPNKFSNETEANQYVSWNQDSNDNSIKGNQLKLNIGLQIEQITGTNTNSYTEIQSINIPIVVNGFYSYNERFESLAKSFYDNTRVASINSKISANVVVENFNSANTPENKLNVLKQYTNIDSFKNINGNITEYLFVATNEEATSINGNFVIDNVSVDSENEMNLVIHCHFVWNNLGINSNVKQYELIASPFLTSNQFINDVNSSLQNTVLYVTEEGQKISSIEVENEFKKDQNSIGNYITLSSIDFNLAETNGIKNLHVSNVIANNSPNTPPTILGYSLTVQMSYTYNGKNYDVNLARPVEGFKSPFQTASNSFYESCEQIQNDLVINSLGRNVGVEEVTSSNWTKYVDGLPTLDSSHWISDFSKEGSNGMNGDLNLSFVYHWDWTYDDGVNQIVWQFSKQITKVILGFRSNAIAAYQNFLALQGQLNNSNYFDTIQINGTKKSDYLSSYFGYNVTSSTANSAVSRAKIGELWNLPQIYGVIVNIKNIWYSYTDSSLSDTQLKIELEIKTDPASGAIDSSYSKTFTMSGFFNPWESFVDGWVNKASGSYFNTDNYSVYSNVPAQYRMGIANWQTTVAAYGNYKPYSYYADVVNNYGGDIPQKTQKWIEYATPIVRTLATSELSTSFTAVSVSDVQFANTGIYRRGSKDTDGICRTSTNIKLTFKTSVVDNKGNVAYGQYRDRTSKNFIYIFLYFSNQYWGG